MKRRQVIGGILSAAALMATAGKAQAADAGAQKSKYTPWVGDLDRSKINWGPTLDADACVGC